MKEMKNEKKLYRSKMFSAVHATAFALVYRAMVNQSVPPAAIVYNCHPISHTR